MTLANAQTQAKWFAKIRQSHQTETTEDYVELIADLIEYEGVAKLSDLSKRFGVSKATVSKIIQRLKNEGYVLHEAYSPLKLTKKGLVLAKKSKERHKIVLDFLIKIGVPADIAEFDAEGIEHHISKETLEVFKKFS